jgi:hypothetical protein
MVGGIVSYLFDVSAHHKTLWFPPTLCGKLPEEQQKRRQVCSRGGFLGGQSDMADRQVGDGRIREVLEKGNMW